MKFLIDPKWNDDEITLHRERWKLLMQMNRCYYNDIKKYQQLAKRYHELNEIIDDDYKC